MFGGATEILNKQNNMIKQLRSKINEDMECYKKRENLIELRKSGNLHKAEDTENVFRRIAA